MKTKFGLLKKNSKGGIMGRKWEIGLIIIKKKKMRGNLI